MVEMLPKQHTKHKYKNIICTRQQSLGKKNNYNINYVNEFANYVYESNNNKK